MFLFLNVQILLKRKLDIIENSIAKGEAINLFSPILKRRVKEPKLIIVPEIPTIQNFRNM